MNKIVWTEDKLNLLIENYSKFGLKHCVDLLKLKSSQISAKVGLLKLKLNKGVKSNICIQMHVNNGGKIYKNFAENFIFCKTKYHAYLLGFLWADGHLGDYHKIGCNIRKDDGILLKNIFFKTGDWRLYERKGYRNSKDQLSFEISNSILYNYLKSNDYYSKSTNSACKILSNIPEKFKHYWFRGLLDGDGYIDEFLVGICSSYDQNWNYMIKLCKKLDIQYKIRREKWFNKKYNKINRCSKIRIMKGIKSRNDISAKVFLDYIYKGYNIDNIGLSRKYKLYVEYFKI